MANKWGIPVEVEKLVLERYKSCVYCGVDFSIDYKSRKTKPSWEHIINDINLSDSNNIALCCTSCNASKGAKKLEDWLNTKYCTERNITRNNVAQIVKNALQTKG